MEGNRLIIKRKIPKGKQELLAIFVGAFVVVVIVGVAQLNATLSTRALASVRTDYADMKTQFADTSLAATAPAKEGVAQAAPTAADTAVEKFKKLLQDTSVPAPTTPSGQ